MTARSAPQTRQLQPGPYRKARFREEPHDIVRTNRVDRKPGLLTETGGAIARALRRTYKQRVCRCTIWAGSEPTASTRSER